MSPESLRQAGLDHYRADRLPEAAQAFAEAAAAYDAAGDRAAAAEMRNNAAVVRMAQADWAGAQAALAGTPELFRALGDRRREGEALANQAAAHDGAGDAEPAVALYLQAIDRLGEAGEAETRAACYKKLSALQIKLGQQLQALASMRSGLNLSSELSPKEKALKELLDKAMKMTGL
jgi:tetratricopeptide (TPR) repeat protein